MQVDLATLSPADFVARVAKGQQNFAMIDYAAEAGRAQSRTDLAQAASLERNTSAFSALLGILVVALMIRFGRRLSSEVLTPVAKLRESANRLAG